MNKNENPNVHNRGGVKVIWIPWIIAIQDKILIPVVTAIIIIAEVKWVRVSTSIPIVNVWWTQTTNPENPIANIA